MFNPYFKGKQCVPSKDALKDMVKLKECNVEIVGEDIC